MAQLTELTAATVLQRETFLEAVFNHVGGQPYSSTGLALKRKEGDTLLAAHVDAVKDLISAPGSGIISHGAQARGGECQSPPAQRTAVPSAPVQPRGRAGQQQAS